MNTYYIVHAESPYHQSAILVFTNKDHANNPPSSGHTYRLLDAKQSNNIEDAKTVAKELAANMASAENPEFFLVPNGIIATHGCEYGVTIGAAREPLDNHEVDSLMEYESIDSVLKGKDTLEQAQLVNTGAPQTFLTKKQLANWIVEQARAEHGCIADLSVSLPDDWKNKAAEIMMESDYLP